MQSSQTLTRRLVPALAVTVVATLVFGAVVVTADAATDSAPLLPDTFGVAAPRQGDAWRYNVTLAGDWTFGSDDEMPRNGTVPFGEFQWVGRGIVRGGDGRMHDANLLHGSYWSYGPQRLVAAEDSEYDDEGNAISVVASSDPYWTESGDDAWVLAGAQTIVSRGGLFAQNESSTDYGMLPPPASVGVGAEYRMDLMEFGFIQYPADETPCLVFNPLQGQNVSLGGDLALFAPCNLGGGFLTVPDGLLFHAADVETVSGVQAIRFDGRLNGTAVQAWFTPSVPYPVRLAASFPDEREELNLEEGDIDAPGARSFVLDMVGFVAGPEELDAVDDPADAQAAAELVMAPWQTFQAAGQEHRIGPSEEGLVHPFPLSTAFVQGYNSTNFADLRTYLGNHADAYVSSAIYGEGRFYGSATSQLGNTRGWSIVMTDGTEEFAFEATMQTFEQFLPTNVGGVVDPRSQAPAQPPVYSFERGYGYGYYFGPWMAGYGAPMPAQVPAQLPTAVSLMERWDGFDTSDLPANTYGFSVGCGEAAEDADTCPTAVATVAGVQRQDTYSGFGPNQVPFPLPGNPYGTEEYVESERLVAFDGAGVATLQLVQDRRSYRSDAQSTLPDQDLQPLPQGGQSDPGYHVASVAVTGIPSSATRWVPEPKEAAGIGFMGLVVGFLYWVWPKLGLVGLFSRLERGELLDHPARAKLVQIVEAQPGIHFHDLAQKAELANGTAVHHLRKLSDSGHLAVRRSGRYTCYFPGGRVDPHTAAAAPLLKSEGARQVLEAVRGKPGMSNLEVAQATGLQPSTVNYHVQRLSQAGLVAALRDGRMVRLHPGIRAGPTGLGDGAPAAGAAA